MGTVPEDQPVVVLCLLCLDLLWRLVSTVYMTTGYQQMEHGVLRRGDLIQVVFLQCFTLTSSSNTNEVLTEFETVHKELIQRMVLVS